MAMDGIAYGHGVYMPWPVVCAMKMRDVFVLCHTSAVCDDLSWCVLSCVMVQNTTRTPEEPPGTDSAKHGR